MRLSWIIPLYDISTQSHNQMKYNYIGPQLHFGVRLASLPTISWFFRSGRVKGLETGLISHDALAQTWKYIKLWIFNLVTMKSPPKNVTFLNCVFCFCLYQTKMCVWTLVKSSLVLGGRTWAESLLHPDVLLVTVSSQSSSKHLPQEELLSFFKTAVWGWWINELHLGLLSGHYMFPCASTCLSHMSVY